MWASCGLDGVDRSRDLRLSVGGEQKHLGLVLSVLWHEKVHQLEDFTTTPATSVIFLNRFLVNSAENVTTGVEIGGDVGMRMTVGEWISSWLCREEGVQFPKSDDDDRYKITSKTVLCWLNLFKILHILNHIQPAQLHVGFGRASTWSFRFTRATIHREPWRPGPTTHRPCC